MRSCLYTRLRAGLIAALLLACAPISARAAGQMDIARYESLRMLVRDEVKNRNYKSAISILNDYISNTANTQIKAQARTLLGDVHYHLRDYYSARDAYAEALRALAGSANVGLNKKLDAARRKIVINEIESIKQALESYYIEHIRYPDNLDELLSIKPELALGDPWGRPYFYIPSPLDLIADVQNQDYVLYCQGAGGQERLGFADRIARNNDIRRQLEANEADKTGFSSNYRIKTIYSRPSGKYSAVLVSTGYLQETVEIEEGSELADGVRVKAVFPEGVVMERGSMLGAVVYRNTND